MRPESRFPFDGSRLNRPRSGRATSTTAVKPKSSTSVELIDYCEWRDESIFQITQKPGISSRCRSLSDCAAYSFPPLGVFGRRGAHGTAYFRLRLFSPCLVKHAA